jgi:hypothetical protein
MNSMTPCPLAISYRGPLDPRLDHGYALSPRSRQVFAAVLGEL